MEPPYDPTHADLFREVEKFCTAQRNRLRMRFKRLSLDRESIEFCAGLDTQYAQVARAYQPSYTTIRPADRSSLVLERRQ